LKLVQIHALEIHVVSTEAIPIPAYWRALENVEEHEDDSVEADNDDDGPTSLTESCVYMAEADVK
jgi:hypothetical protein